MHHPESSRDELIHEASHGATSSEGCHTKSMKKVSQECHFDGMMDPECGFNTHRHVSSYFSHDACLFLVFLLRIFIRYLCFFHVSVCFSLFCSFSFTIQFSLCFFFAPESLTHTMSRETWVVGHENSMFAQNWCSMFWRWLAKANVGQAILEVGRRQFRLFLLAHEGLGFGGEGCGAHPPVPGPSDQGTQGGVGGTPHWLASPGGGGGGRGGVSKGRLE